MFKVDVIDGSEYGGDFVSAMVNVEQSEALRSYIDREYEEARAFASTLGEIGENYITNLNAAYNHYQSDAALERFRQYKDIYQNELLNRDIGEIVTEDLPNIFYDEIDFLLNEMAIQGLQQTSKRNKRYLAANPKLAKALATNRVSGFIDFDETEREPDIPLEYRTDYLDVINNTMEFKESEEGTYFLTRQTFHQEDTVPLPTIDKHLTLLQWNIVESLLELGVDVTDSNSVAEHLKFKKGEQDV